MAEIKIEKKKPIWPWIVAILLIAGVVYYIYCTDHEVTTVNRVENTANDTITASDTITTN